MLTQPLHPSAPCRFAQGAEKDSQIVSSMSTRQRNLANMVAVQHGYDAMATAAQRRSFEGEHVNVEPKTPGRRRRSEGKENSCAEEEETTGRTCWSETTGARVIGYQSPEAMPSASKS